jgi:uncharacterized protein YdaU (DUF1376 family)
MKETFYFSHDYGARNDERIVKLIQKYGLSAYGIYWILIEKLYEEGGFLTKDYDCIAFELRTESERIKEVIDSDLFKSSNDKFYSESCLARLRARKGKSEKARQSAFLRWNKPKESNANAMRTQCGGNAIKESKVKERKGKKSKIIISEQSSQNIQEIFKIFYEINPTINFGNITQRKSAKRLIDKLGVEKAIGSAKAAVSIFGKQYAPTITTPIQLETKLSELVGFYKKNQLNSNNNVLKI